MRGDEYSYEETKVQDMISGAACGVKRGEPGSLVDRNQCEHEPYSGMASGPWQKKLVQMVLGQDDLHGTRSIFGATPEATQHEQILTLEEGSMKVKGSKWTVPNRQVWSRWVEGRVD